MDSLRFVHKTNKNSQRAPYTHDTHDVSVYTVTKFQSINKWTYTVCENRWWHIPTTCGISSINQTTTSDYVVAARVSHVHPCARALVRHIYFGRQVVAEPCGQQRIQIIAFQRCILLDASHECETALLLGCMYSVYRYAIIANRLSNFNEQLGPQTTYKVICYWTFVVDVVVVDHRCRVVCLWVWANECMCKVAHLHS